MAQSISLVSTITLQGSLNSMIDCRQIGPNHFLNLFFIIHFSLNHSLKHSAFQNSIVLFLRLYWKWIGEKCRWLVRSMFLLGYTYSFYLGCRCRFVFWIPASIWQVLNSCKIWKENAKNGHTKNIFGVNNEQI